MKQIYLCSNTKFDDPDIINLNLLQIKFNKFSLNLNKFDALIVTSKNSINSLKFNQISPFNIEIFAIGEATKNACLDFGFSNISTPISNHGDEFIKEILPQLKSKNILFLRAKETSSNISEILRENSIKFTQIIAYENEILPTKPNLIIAQNSVIIFTSPKNLEAFIKHFGFRNDLKAVCIGKTTALALENYATAIISPKQDLAQCIKIAKSLANE